MGKKMVISCLENEKLKIRPGRGEKEAAVGLLAWE